MARTLPDWPAMMRKDYAAAYLDMPVAKFERGVLAGKLPAPAMVLDEERWSRAKLDAYLERLTGGGQDRRSRSKLYGEAA